MSDKRFAPALVVDVVPAFGPLVVLWLHPTQTDNEHRRIVEANEIFILHLEPKKRKHKAAGMTDGTIPHECNSCSNVAHNHLRFTIPHRNALKSINN